VLFGAFNQRPVTTNDLARITDLEPPEICQLSAGRAVRLRRLYQSTKVQRWMQRWYAETFAMPLGTTGELAGILQFSTTNVGLAREFSELFAGFAQTVTFFGPHDPTVMNADGPDDAGDEPWGVVR
jgi:hypothetical protein